MQINARHLRQIIREELMLLTEQSVLSGYRQPTTVPPVNGSQIKIETQPPPAPTGSTAPPAVSRIGISKKLEIKVVIPVPLVGEVTKFLPISNIRIESWNPAAPDGQSFMTVVFSVTGKPNVKASFKNKLKMRSIAEAILNGTTAEGEMIPVDPADTSGAKAALIVNRPA